MYFSSLSNYIRSYFILDIYTGTIQTSKLLDLENFCDLNICKNRAFKVLNSSSSQHNGAVNNIGAQQQQNCLIEFKIKASRFAYNTANSTTANGSSAASIVYHISFDLIIRDENEFRPEFLNRHSSQEPVRFNVSEEFAPIKLAVGSVAYDNDCNDRGRVVYSLRVVRVNGRLFEDWFAEMRHFLASKSSPYADFMRKITTSGNRSASIGSNNMFEFQVEKSEKSINIYLIFYVVYI